MEQMDKVKKNFGFGCMRLPMNGDQVTLPRPPAWWTSFWRRDSTILTRDRKSMAIYHFYKNDSGQFEIDDLYVFPEFQNQGIGSTIVRKCCASTNAPIMLYVFIKNERAVSLYKRLGFKVTETIHNSRYIMKNENKKILHCL